MNVLAIAVTNRCPLRCAFCCVPPGPGDLASDRIDRLIADVVAQPERWSSVGFTGGEPLLRADEVAAHGARLAAAGIDWGVTTGLGWASNEKRATRVAGQLLQGGIRDVNISYDPSHRSELRTDAYRAFCGTMAGGDVNIIVSTTLFNGESIEDSEIVERLGLPGIDRVRIDRHYVAQVGNAATRSDCSSSRIDLARAICPLRQGFTLSVWPDGEVYPCCSTYIVNKATSLSLGNIGEHSIAQLLDAAEADPYLVFIRRLGFAHLIALFANEVRELVDAFGEIPSDACHLCSKLANAGAIPTLREAILAKGAALAAHQNMAALHEH